LRLTKIVSLLQPPPETVANFDELILLGEGKIIYSGPVAEVIDYFNSLGYEIPERMDVADWLQVSKEMMRYHMCRGNRLTSVLFV
jgi:ABC-type multidrug transport system ATPase subunit